MTTSPVCCLASSDTAAYEYVIKPNSEQCFKFESWEEEEEGTLCAPPVDFRSVPELNLPETMAVCVAVIGKENNPLYISCAKPEQVGVRSVSIV